MLHNFKSNYKSILKKKKQPVFHEKNDKVWPIALVQDE